MSKQKKKIISFYNRYHQKNRSLPLIEEIKQGNRVNFLKKLAKPIKKTTNIIRSANRSLVYPE